MKHFERARYADAARAFLEADKLLPNPDALTNAIVAGRKANEHLLVAIAAERVLSRSDSGERKQAQAREALAEASLQLARLDLSCSPAPCTLILDGASVPGGKRFVQPGVVEIVAQGADARRTERFKLAAGANYAIAIKIDEPETSPLMTTATATATAPPQPAAAPPSANPAPPPREPERSSEPRKALPPGVFYAGVAATALAAGITTWSGLSAIDTYNAVPSRPTQDQVDDAQAEITRTDVLFAITLGLGAATALGGVFFVDWQGAGSEEQTLRIGVRGKL
ncbi:MAG TPA: hypothetical protein VM686_15375 [Polyangiaceae bacterium]|nr:hypothetical protein [Polyangiaceae bacterium]